MEWSAGVTMDNVSVGARCFLRKPTAVLKWINIPHAPLLFRNVVQIADSDEEQTNYILMFLFPK